MRKRYVLVGAGARSRMYIEAILKDFNDVAELVALCDINQGRLELANRYIVDCGGKQLNTFSATSFDRMVGSHKPNTVIITSGPDSTHDYYICRAMELGCDVITEKPITIDEKGCKKIFQTVRKTGRECQVAFNYRYSPPRSQVKKLTQEGKIGEILSIDFTWSLDTRHGADYFRRWHRRIENSGSLLVHKCTHHFDLVNWWIGDVPEEVFCWASRNYYNPEMATSMGLQDRSERCYDCPVKNRCNFYLDIENTGYLWEMYFNNEHYDGYIRDACVFSEEIDIWDTMAVTVRYHGGALLSYFLHAYSPVEGYRIALNGNQGRIEHSAFENTYIHGDGTVPGELEKEKVSITLIPEFSKPQPIEPWTSKGAHGGGDALLLVDLFHPNRSSDPLSKRANYLDGALSVLVGIAAYKSIQAGRSVKIKELLGDVSLVKRH